MSALEGVHDNHECERNDPECRDAGTAHRNLPIEALPGLAEKPNRTLNVGLSTSDPGRYIRVVWLRDVYYLVSGQVFIQLHPEIGFSFVTMAPENLSLDKHASPGMDEAQYDAAAQEWAATREEFLSLRQIDNSAWDRSVLV